MFYLHTFLAKKNPLGTVWIAAHLERKIKKHQLDEIDIPSYAGSPKSLFFFCLIRVSFVYFCGKNLFFLLFLEFLRFFFSRQGFNLVFLVGI